ncbi:hypothetical protein GCM10010421_19050 [Streptomyces glaucus]|uniref:Secreted protein n=1 Tax=Streptomyces glaucus TaxID=284029 RepID=A0ABP5WMM6_9ACTN
MSGYERGFVRILTSTWKAGRNTVTAGATLGAAGPDTGGADRAADEDERELPGARQNARQGVTTCPCPAARSGIPPRIPAMHRRRREPPPTRNAEGIADLAPKLGRRPTHGGET